MPESSLNIAFIELQGEVGYYLGYGRGADNGDSAWDSEQSKQITSSLKGGMRRFYYPGWTWSFRKPFANLTLSEGNSEVELPDDYNGLCAPVSIVFTGGTQNPTLLVYAPSQIHAGRNRAPDQTGMPQFVAVEAIKGTDVSRSNRMKLVVWPTADQDYTLQIQYAIHPNYLTGSQPYAYGGPAHAQTLLAACRADAEVNIDKIKDGPLMADFEKLLAISREIDCDNEAHTLGVLQDPSDSRNRSSRYRGDLNVTYNGQEAGV